MFLAGALVLVQGSLLGLVLIACFLIPNVVGLILWRLRDRIAPYPAAQALVVLMGVFALLALVAFDVSGRLALYARGSPRSVYWILAVFPMVMLMFHSKDRSGKNGRDSQ
jgi:hypothetical protein